MRKKIKSTIQRLHVYRRGDQHIRTSYIYFDIHETREALDVIHQRILKEEEGVKNKQAEKRDSVSHCGEL